MSYMSCFPTFEIGKDSPHFTERPIRSFEIVSEVTNSWLVGKMTNSLVVKKTPLAAKLSRAVSFVYRLCFQCISSSSQALPTSSPVYSGWVQHEYKKGKWQKRWMELREHSLWLSKRDTVSSCPHALNCDSHSM